MVFFFQLTTRVDGPSFQHVLELLLVLSTSLLVVAQFLLPRAQLPRQALDGRRRHRRGVDGTRLGHLPHQRRQLALVLLLEHGDLAFLLQVGVVQRGGELLYVRLLLLVL